MGKVKQVIMGDEVQEEKARKKAAEKRASKKQLRHSGEPEATPESVIEKPKTEKKDSGQARMTEEKDSGPFDTAQGKPGQPRFNRGQNDDKKKKKKVQSTKFKSGSGKKYVEAEKLVDRNKTYSPDDAFDLVKKTSYSKFVGSVEVHINVMEKGIRGSVSLPHGTGKTIRVKVADDALITVLEKTGSSAIDFDILVAAPSLMPKLARVAKILGPRGLMPNPKTGTIGENVEELALRLRSGQQSWKTEGSFPIIHLMIGKVDFETKDLVENFLSLVKSIGREKIVSIFVKATMGPSIKITI